MATSNGLKLSSSDSRDHPFTQTIFDPTKFNTSRDYNQAQVEQKNPVSTSFYVVYQDDYENNTYTADDSQMVPTDLFSGSSEQDQTSFVIASARGYDNIDKQIIVFGHAGYRGTALALINSDPDITGAFTAAEIGASSYISTGGKWELYTERNYKGGMIPADPHSVNKFVGGANDKIKSVKYVGKQ